VSFFRIFGSTDNHILVRSLLYVEQTFRVIYEIEHILIIVRLHRELGSLLP